ncbi:PREDICTED: small RNA 2'-O-methyltransferase isoform X2 [Rhagoletis zephyria]|uniref:small RNA 2'-O-methyltransferase isoform X2 n=1 Tax=Rhagoletis zephyria TaxID=28612 RepID=UPI0008115E8E|nr:PREDICTED: small RNA 2'-O-methyltransferase isoform X2 [Rhagoletis zephyria]XP_036331462.1 small RNA 2'-O-methyltransferase isoform X2 [Rhagoletis pomonella]
MVDIDEDILRSNKLRAEPLVSDYLKKREGPLRVELLKGSIDASVEQLLNVDAVIALEIIEHLYPKTLENVPKNIFGFMQPKIAIFSTPNSEFNVLFEPLLENGFRHDDHKFEWTRTEFKDWALNICQKYHNYSVAFIGVGDAPPDKKDIGYVTQIAIFARNDLLDRSLTEPFSSEVPVDCDPDADVQYKEIFAVDFPYNRDERSKEQKILDEARYQIDRCRRIDRYFNRDLGVYQVPLTVLKDFIETLGASMQELLAILKENDIEVKGDYIILPEYDEDDLSYRHYDDCYDDEYGLWNDVGCNDDETENDDELGACGGYSHTKDDATYDSEENWD